MHTRVLAWVPGLFMGAVVLVWDGYTWADPIGWRTLKSPPSHWRPLPAPPVEPGT